MYLTRWIGRFSVWVVALLAYLLYEANSLPSSLGVARTVLPSAMPVTTTHRPSNQVGRQMNEWLSLRLHSMRLSSRWAESLSCLPVAGATLLPLFSASDCTFWGPLAIAVVIRLFILEPRYIPSNSMAPTLNVGDRFLVDKLSRRLRRGDIVVFRSPKRYTEMTGTHAELVKRVVAMEGDVVEIADGSLVLNGSRQQEPFVSRPADYKLSATSVSPGMLFVLGDNRCESFDSHNWGLVPTRNVIGKAVFRYWPPSRAGLITVK